MADTDTNTENGTTDVSGTLGDAVEAVEDATVEAYKAAIEAGDLEAAERVHAAVTESLRRAVADVEDAAETVEQVAEEVAADAPAEAAEAAEDAVEAAHDAAEAVDEAAAEIRAEQREAGGAEVTEDQAIHQEIHEAAEDVIESSPVEVQPVVEATEDFEHEMAESVPESNERPPLIKPEAEHPYYRKRKIFGISF